MATTDTPAPRTLTQLRDAIHRALDDLTPHGALVAGDEYATQLHHLTGAILDLDQVIAANRPRPSLPPEEWQNDALTRVWNGLQEAGYPTAASDAAVAALRAAPLFGGGG